MLLTYALGRIEINLKFVDAIQDEWTMVEPCFNYEAGTNGPLESDLLLSRDGNHWWTIFINLL